MDLASVVALGGIIIAAMSVELNDAVTSALLPEISGGLGFGHDPGTWFSSLYASAEVVGMAVSPWFLVTITLRRWSLCIVALSCMSTILIPTTSNLSLLYGLRVLQGLSEGLTIPLLMTTALRVLSPSIRLYGLAAYSLSASFFPALATALAALWVGSGDSALGWQFAFYQTIPISALAAVMIWWGMPQDAPQYSRIRTFNWSGALLVVLAFGSLSTMMLQGDRLDWFNSNTIVVLGCLSAVGLPLLLVNEWFAEAPFLKLQLLARRNIAFGLIGLFTFVMVGGVGSTIPLQYLGEVRAFLPEQSYSVTALLAATQLVFLPLMALLLNEEWIDARWINLTGLGFVLAGAVGDSLLSDVWDDSQFYLWQVLISLGEAMVVMSLLMLATNAVKPPEAAFASSLINTPRALGDVAATWLVELVARWRGALHSSRLTDQAGQQRFTVLDGATALPNVPVPFNPAGMPRAPGSLAGFAQTVGRQADILTLSDTFLVMAAIIAALMVVVIILPVRSLPPRIALARH
ncbi:MFS transporter [Acidisoma sp.]|uniref:MFS transporter n=1 Tax=Acidisoma sp. TaxID=1872115 RepID=UPI003AFFAF96